jgi:regulator of RNase E activity RraA
VWSLGTCPNGPLELRKRADTALLAANIGKVTVTAEDYVFADDDGVVVVSAQDLQRIITTAKDIADREGAQAVRLMKGELLRDQLDLQQYVSKRNTDPSFTFRDHLKSFGGAIEI